MFQLCNNDCMLLFMNKYAVLIIDDDEALQEVLSQYLESDGYQISQAFSASEATDKVREENIDVILLDLVLPDEAGLGLIPQIQAHTKAGIIVVSGKTDTTEKIVCLEMGADDYLTKPFEMRELSARIKAVTRRMSEKQETKSSDPSSKQKVAKLHFESGWCLDREQYQVFSPANESVDLTIGEFELFNALINSPHRALKREYLFDLTRDGKFDVYDRAIDIQIARLRKKIDTGNKDLIKTVRGVGYMFTGKLD